MDGSNSKMRVRMQLSSSEMGRIELKKVGSLMKALKVESSEQALFHGFRPQVKFTRMTPSDHTSFGADW